MDEKLAGAIGTRTSLGLRIGQVIFLAASLGLFISMPVEFQNCTSFSFIVMVTVFMISWSVTFAIIDAFYIFVDPPPPLRLENISIVTIGDWGFSFLSLAVACSTTSLINVLITSGGPSGVPLCVGKKCLQYQMFAAMAFLSWLLLLASSVCNFWVLPSLIRPPLTHL